MWSKDIKILKMLSVRYVTKNWIDVVTISNAFNEAS